MERASKVLVGIVFVLVAQQSAPGVADLNSPPGSVQSMQAAEVHNPPVDAPIIDPFRPPDELWLAGNRGIEYDTDVDQIVRASAGGVVTFSGQVGGDLFVTIRHSSDLRTTAGFVQSMLVAVGDTVVQGQPIAIAGPTMHFSARRNDEYIDPAVLFRRGRIVVRLVPGPG